MKRHARRAPAAMTLIELMVATALGVMLIGIVTFVWLQSNRIFSTTVHRLETYQRLRSVLDTVERDLANTRRTVDMEFYDDVVDPSTGEANGHYDPDDTLIDFRTPRAGDLLAGGEEFGLPGFPGTNPYVFAPTILSPPPYKIAAGYTENRFYWRDEIYVRTFASVDGLNRPALVHYRLVPTGDGRSALRRRVWWLNDANDFVPAPVDDATERTTILTNGIADLKIGFYFKETPSEKEGSWFHVGDHDGTFDGNFLGEAVDPDGLGRGQALLEADAARGFQSARSALSANTPEALATQFQTAGGASLNAVSFVFEGNARIEEAEFLPVMLRTLAGGDLDDLPLASPPDLAHYTNFDFPGVRPGDRVLIYGATDDDDYQAVGATREAKAAFEDRLLTVDTITTLSSGTGKYTSIKFREPVDFARLKADWLGDEPLFHVKPSHLSTYPLAGPARDYNPVGDDPDDGRKIKGSFNVRYRVGFLPAAFIVRLSCDDTYNRKILPMERVIRLVQQ